MKKVKITLLIITILVFVFSLIGCGFDRDLKSTYNDSKRIAAQGDSYTFANRVENSKDNSIELEFLKFSGSDTVFYVKAEKQGQIKVSFDSSLEGGKFKGVMITPQDEILTVFEHSEKEKNPQGTYTVNAEAGTYRFKIVGYNAKGDMKLQVELADGMELNNPTE